MQRSYYQKRIDIVLKDFESQMQSLDKLAIILSADTKYQYSTLTQKNYNEIVMLEDLETYRYSSPLSDEFFLYYESLNPNAIYHSTGCTINLDVYLKPLPEAESQQLKDALHNIGQTTELLPLNNGIYAIMPFKSGNRSKTSRALLVYFISADDLGERFQVVSGGLTGTISLYCKESLLYCNQEVPCTAETAKVLTSTSQKENFTLCYLPKIDLVSYDYNSLSYFQIFLILMDILLIMTISRIFAQKAYSPLKNLHSKYSDSKVPPNDENYNNIFSELDGIISNALQQLEAATMLVEEKQELLKQQILRQLLNGTNFSNIQPYLEKLNISLPGPYFYVICISFSHETVDQDFLILLKKELEQINVSNDNEHVYVISNTANSQLWAICSVPCHEHKNEMTELVSEVSGSYSFKPIIGIGKVYDSLSKISASWLEGIANLSNDSSEEEENHHDFIYNPHNLSGLEDALSAESAEEALNWLECYTEELKDQATSLLMQQYIFAQFIGEISKLSGKNQITLSNQSISLLISARNVPDFQEAAQKAILEYLDKFRSRIQYKKNDQDCRICEYIKAHFLEYDVSIEKFAEDLNVSVAAVREAVIKTTGKTYKDYLVFLRIGHAQKLLNEGELTVAEISETVGYSCVSYFIRVFKEITGTTPAKYKKRNRE